VNIHEDSWTAAGPGSLLVPLSPSRLCNSSLAFSFTSSSTSLKQLKPVTVDVNAKKGFAGFANKLSSLSIGKPKKEEPVDYSIDDRAVYLLIKGALLKSAEKIDEAIECFREVIRLEPVIREKYYVPYCLFEFGECMYQKGNLKEAQEAMKKCNNISGYDWEDPLKVRLRVTIDQLKKGGVSDADLDEEEAGAGPSVPEVQPTTVAAN